MVGADVTDANPPGDEAGEGPDGPRPPRSGWLRRAVPWLLALAALGAATFSTWQWRDLQQRAAAREDVRVATASFMATLTDWDASEGLDETREELREAGTGPFLEEVDEFFGRLTGRLAATVTSQGRVRDVYVQELSGDTARSFAVVVQTISRDGDEATTVRYADLALQRVDDRWLVAEVRLLADDTRPAPAGPAPTVPGAGGEGTAP